MKVKLKLDLLDIRTGLVYNRKHMALALSLPIVKAVLYIKPFHNWMEELKVIANKWSPKEYPLDSKWCLEYWKKFYDEGNTPQATWTEYTTMVN